MSTSWLLREGGEDAAPPACLWAPASPLPPPAAASLSPQLLAWKRRLWGHPTFLSLPSENPLISSCFPTPPTPFPTPSLAGVSSWLLSAPRDAPGARRCLCNRCRPACAAKAAQLLACGWQSSYGPFPCRDTAGHGADVLLHRLPNPTADGLLRLPQCKE